MRLMRKSTDTRNRRRIMMLSLPDIPVAIAFLMLVATLLPFSDSDICRTAALVEQRCVYGIYAGNRQVACFSGTAGGREINGLAEAGDSSAVTTVLTEGCWVNGMPLVPSCRGRILVPRCHEEADKEVTAMNRNIRAVLKKEADRQRSVLRRLSAVEAELEYYMSVHNVQDEGFNSVAEHAGHIKADRERTARLIKILDKALKEKNVRVAHAARYTLITRVNGQKTQRTACRTTGEDYTHGFVTIQTEDGKTPSGAVAIYINRIAGCRADSADAIKAAGICGAGTAGFVPSKAETLISAGRMGGNQEHDMPPLLVPDGSPVFSRHGFFLGICKGGKVVEVKSECAKNGN